MMKLEWDPELAQVAQRLADQCIFNHDCADCRQVLFILTYKARLCVYPCILF